MDISHGLPSNSGLAIVGTYPGGGLYPWQTTKDSILELRLLRGLAHETEEKKRES